MLIICTYLLIRNEKVSRFRVGLIDLADKGCEKLINDLGCEYFLRPYDIYNSVSYEKMLYSTKPLRIDVWYTEEEIKQMKGER